MPRRRAARVPPTSRQSRTRSESDDSAPARPSHRRDRPGAGRSRAWPPPESIEAPRVGRSAESKPGHSRKRRRQTSRCQRIVRGAGRRPAPIVAPASSSRRAPAARDRCRRQLQSAKLEEGRCSQMDVRMAAWHGARRIDRSCARRQRAAGLGLAPGELRLHPSLVYPRIRTGSARLRRGGHRFTATGSSSRIGCRVPPARRPDGRRAVMPRRLYVCRRSRAHPPLSRLLPSEMPWASSGNAARFRDR